MRRKRALTQLTLELPETPADVEIQKRTEGGGIRIR